VLPLPLSKVPTCRDQQAAQCRNMPATHHAPTLVALTPRGLAPPNTMLLQTGRGTLTSAHPRVLRHHILIPRRAWMSRGHSPTISDSIRDPLLDPSARCAMLRAQTSHYRVSWNPLALRTTAHMAQVPARVTCTSPQRKLTVCGRPRLLRSFLLFLRIAVLMLLDSMSITANTSTEVINDFRPIRRRHSRPSRTVGTLLSWPLNLIAVCRIIICLPDVPFFACLLCSHRLLHLRRRLFDFRLTCSPHCTRARLRSSRRCTPLVIRH